MKKCMELKTIALVLGVSLLLAGLIGCSGSKKYRVDYDGEKSFYSHAKDTYKAGTEVTVYFELIATDTDYTFYLDGEPLKVDYDSQKGFVIRFTMPAHDVTLSCNTVNTMAPPMDPAPENNIPEPSAPPVGVWNPVSAISLDDLARETGYHLNLPEESFQELRVRRIDADPILYSLAFVYEDGKHYTFRMVSGMQLSDISGMYYNWTKTEVCEDLNYQVYMTDTGQGFCIWWDPFSTYCVSMEANATLDALTDMRLRMIRSWENTE